MRYLMRLRFLARSAPDRTAEQGVAALVDLPAWLRRAAAAAPPSLAALARRVVTGKSVTTPICPDPDPAIRRAGCTASKAREPSAGCRTAQEANTRPHQRSR